MAKHGKNYRKVAELVDAEALYSPLQATGLAKQTSTTSYDATVEVAIRLGVDPRKADQMVRGTVNQPHGLAGAVERGLVDRLRGGAVALAALHVLVLPLLSSRGRRSQCGPATGAVVLDRAGSSGTAVRVSPRSSRPSSARCPR